VFNEFKICRKFHFSFTRIQSVHAPLIFLFFSLVYFFCFLLRFYKLKMRQGRLAVQQTNYRYRNACTWHAKARMLTFQKLLLTAARWWSATLGQNSINMRTSAKERAQRAHNYQIFLPLTRFLHFHCERPRPWESAAFANLFRRMNECRDTHCASCTKFSC